MGIDTFISFCIAAIGAGAALYSKAVAAENKTLKTQIDALESQHAKDIQRINEGTRDIWSEIKVQRESLTQNREAVIRLNSSLDRLNEILGKLEQSIGEKVSHEQCENHRAYYPERRQNERLRVKVQAEGKD